MVALRRGTAGARAASRPLTADVPVIVIGNIAAGGTGKTPLVIWLTQTLRARGIRVGVVSRGHGGSAGNTVLHVTPHTAPADCGDEPALIARVTGAPVIVCRDRRAACEALMQQSVQLILSDDGLQHLRMSRQVEIAVIDGVRGLGNARLLPAGPLREPASRLRSVDAIVYNDTPATAQWRRPTPAPQGRPSAPALFSMRLRSGVARQLRSGEMRPLSAFADGGTVHAVAGIGNPQRFFDSLTAAGLHIHAHPFPDHYCYAATDLQFGGPNAVLMTAKDAVKCQSFVDDRLWQVDVEAEFSPSDRERLLALVIATLPPPAG